MRFGLHFLLSCSEQQSPQQRYRDTVEQAVFGESLGFDSVWPVEHHFHSAASIMPAPNLLLAAIAQRTHALRLGTGIVQLPLNHPLRVAEELCTLDVLSDGRAELGVGRGGNAAHFAGYGVEMSESRERFAESVDFIETALREPRFSFAGRYYRAEDAALAPRPVQARPPLRVAANSPETLRWAGLRGYPVIMASHIFPLAKLPELLTLYRHARQEGGHAPVVDDVTLLMPFYVGETRAAAESEAAPAVAHFAKTASALTEAAIPKCKTAEERAHLSALVERLTKVDYAMMADGMGCFGDAAECTDLLGRVREELRVERVITWFDMSGRLPHAMVLRAMRRFSEQVLPRLV